MIAIVIFMASAVMIVLLSDSVVYAAYLAIAFYCLFRIENVHNYRSLKHGLKRGLSIIVGYLVI